MRGAAGTAAFSASSPAPQGRAAAGGCPVSSPMNDGSSITTGNTCPDAPPWRGSRRRRAHGRDLPRPLGQRGAAAQRKNFQARFAIFLAFPLVAEALLPA